MARNGDGVYVCEDCLRFWVSYKDAAGRRRRSKLGANPMEQAKIALSDSRRPEFGFNVFDPMDGQGYQYDKFDTPTGNI